MKGVGEYQIKAFMGSYQKILTALASGDWVRYCDIVKSAGVGTTTASKFLKSMEEAGEVEKKVDLTSGEYPYPVLYKLTPKGLAALKALLRQEAVERSHVCNLTKNVREKLLERVKKTIGYMAPSLEAKRGNITSKLKAILMLYATTSTLGFLKPLGQASQKLSMFSETIAEGLDIAVDPPVEKAEEEDSIGDGVLDLLNHALRSKTYREKVAKTGKMTIVITLDISKVNMPPEEKREALFWGLVFEGLRREGKV
jgi:DNA-binding MarR family transcriptional regulator